MADLPGASQAEVCRMERRSEVTGASLAASERGQERRQGHGDSQQRHRAR